MDSCGIKQMKYELRKHCKAFPFFFKRIFQVAGAWVDGLCQSVVLMDFCFKTKLAEMILG